jgi:hypothetical protein
MALPHTVHVVSFGFLKSMRFPAHKCKRKREWFLGQHALSLSKGGFESELFLPKSDERLDSCRATRGDVRGESGDGSEEREHRHVC